jgi:hypothetical protein
MTPTHADVTRAMFAASVAMEMLLAADLTPEQAVYLGALTEAMRLACERLHAIEAAIQHKGKRH